jgi:hypothetical protein
MCPQVECRALRPDFGDHAVHARLEARVVDDAVGRQRGRQCTRADGLGLDLQHMDQAAVGGDLVRHVRLHHRHAAALPRPAVHTHARQPLRRHVHDDAAHRAHGRRAQDAHVQQPVRRQPHEALAVARAGRHRCCLVGHAVVSVMIV